MATDKMPSWISKDRSRWMSRRIVLGMDLVELSSYVPTSSGSSFLYGISAVEWATARMIRYYGEPDLDLGSSLYTLTHITMD